MEKMGYEERVVEGGQDNTQENQEISNKIEGRAATTDITFTVDEILNNGLISDLDCETEKMKIEETENVEVNSNRDVMALNLEFKFRVTLLQAVGISTEYSDVFCQFK